MTGSKSTISSTSSTSFAAALLAAALLLPGGAAQAQTPSAPRNQCGMPSGLTDTPPYAATCSDQAYANGIRYDVMDGWGEGVAHDVALTVTGGAATRITAPVSPPNGWTDAAIVVRTAMQGDGDGTSRNVVLNVGAGDDDGNDVAIVEASGATSNGIWIHQRGNAEDSTTVTLGSGVTIGSAGTPMAQYGVNTLVEMAGNSGDHTITSAATIHSTNFGILMDARGSGNVAVTNSGSITTAEPGGNANEKSGIRILDWSGTSGDERTADTTTTVTNSGTITVSAANAHGIHVDAEGLGLYRTVNSGTVSASGADGYGVYVDARYYAGAAGIEIENSGSISTSGAGGHGINVVAAGSGPIEITNRGPIESTSIAIVVNADMNPVRVTNSGDLKSSSAERAVLVIGTEGSVTFTHEAGEIYGEAGVGISALIGRWRNEGAADSPDPVGAASVRVEVTGGTVKASETLGSVAIEAHNNEGGSVEVEISEGAEVLAMNNAAIYAVLSDRQNAAGRIEVVQGGEIRARRGVYAQVTYAPTAETDARRAAAQPLIDITWTGTFTEPAAAAAEPRDASHAVGVAQEKQAGEVFRGHTAGIDAQVMSWRHAMRAVAESDDPGVITAAGQTSSTGVPTGATAADNDYVAAFRAALGNDDISASALLTAIDPSATSLDDVSDAEIVTYLQTDDDATRTLLRNLLAQSFSDEEKAVLRAVAAGDRAGLDAALTAAGFTDDPDNDEDYWSKVRALLDRRNDGDINIAMTGGSIVSHGDGIRAWYATPHPRNGSIDVTVARGASVTGGAAGIYAANAGAIDVTVAGGASVTGGEAGIYAANAGAIDVTVAGGTTVTGGEAGIYVANAGAGLQIEKKYAPPAVQVVEANREREPDDLVTFPDEYPNQIVRVQGTVTGGTDAAVHLVGGGALIVTGEGRVVAGSSGVAIRVNDPGPAVIYIEGEVRGGEGADAAVHLTGGGSVTIGVNGRVRANGAAAAIRGDLAANEEPTVVVVHTRKNVRDLTQGGAREVLARVEGGIVGDGVEEEVIIAETTEAGDLVLTTGHMKVLPVRDGVPVFDDLPPDTFQCSTAMDNRCRLYEALPSALLAMNGLPSYAERASAARDANGSWARVEASRGDWEAKKEEGEATPLAYDYRRSTVRVGFDFLAGESGRAGVSVHALGGKAEMGGVGEVDLDGVGAGLSATWQVGDLYVDAQAGATVYDLALDSATATSGRLVKAVGGTGYALDVDVGWRMAMGGMTLTPRAGLAWSKVDVKDFTDTVGSGARVSVEDAQSTKGRVGVMVETGAGSEGPGRVFGSVDVEHEFSDETSVNVSGDLQETTVEPTGVRVGLGWALSLRENVSLSAALSYTAGGGADEYGGGAGLDVRF